MLLGAIDLGSNSLKHTVARLEDGALSILEQGEQLVRIVEGVERRGRLGLSGIKRALAGFDHLRERFDELGVQRQKVVATASLRGMANADVVLRGAAKRGFDIEVVDGDREAALAFAGPARRYGPGRVAVFDVGGRSTEIVVGTADRIEHRVSLPLGSVLLTERHLHTDPPTPLEVEAVRQDVREVLAEAPELDPATPLVGVAGTALALFGHAQDLAFMPEVLLRAEGRRLTVLEITRSLETLRAQRTEDRYLGDVIPPRRADVIVAGAALVAGILARYRRLYFTVSSEGIRNGLLDELVDTTRT